MQTTFIKLDLALEKNSLDCLFTVEKPGPFVYFVLKPEPTFKHIFLVLSSFESEKVETN